ncbi:unnamed protein product [Owenia fusiformis]|uniref:Uncharacterized protein n=1 Tax=Owenia fusiformis TaxID=6347 RepID=A0A8J1XYK2_OWEFU|nr:unnamed protein product [Owenia fusiformis]
MEHMFRVIVMTTILTGGRTVETSDQSDMSEPYYVMEYISDGQFNSSSFGTLAKYARINSTSAWLPRDINPITTTEWIQVDLGKTMCIYGIVTKGRHDQQQWTTVYKLHYRKDGDINFLTLKDDGKEKLLSANRDQDTAVGRNFTKPFDARFIRLYPKCWDNYAAIRFDLLVSNNICPSDTMCEKYPSFIPSSSSAMIIGLIIGMVLFMIISIILLILLIFSYRELSRCKYATEAVQLHHTGNNNKREVNQGVSMPLLTSNMYQKTEPKDMYAQVDVKTKRPKSDTIHPKTDDAGYSIIADCKDTTPPDVYHTPADVGVHNIEKKENMDVPDGIKMYTNEIYKESPSIEA